MWNFSVTTLENENLIGGPVRKEVNETVASSATLSLKCTQRNGLKLQISVECHGSLLQQTFRKSVIKMSSNVFRS